MWGSYETGEMDLTKIEHQWTDLHTGLILEHLRLSVSLLGCLPPQCMVDRLNSQSRVKGEWKNLPSAEVPAAYVG